ncbi:MAG TPA: DUF6130 family protein [Myxococcota bacterium]|nr:DUF6130 family protein [Myxococcota bacterium]
MHACARALVVCAGFLWPLGALAEPTLSAKLVDREAKARKGEMTVEVSVSGLEIVDAAKAMEQPTTGQGHLHYRLDDGPVVATTATKLSFHGLAAGSHRLEVRLAGNDHKPLGPAQNLSITVPDQQASGAAQKPAPPARPADRPNN